MKTKTNYTLLLTLSIYALIFIIPILYLEIQFNKGIGLFCSVFSFLFIFMGLLKTESYNFTDKKLIKRNLLGVIEIEYPLNQIFSLNKKFVNQNFSRNPLNITKLYTKGNKYLEFHVLTCKFKGNKTLKIDSRSMNKREFDSLTKTIKAQIKLNKKQ